MHVSLCTNYVLISTIPGTVFGYLYSPLSLGLLKHLLFVNKITFLDLLTMGPFSADILEWKQPLSFHLIMSTIILLLKS